MKRFFMLSIILSLIIGIVGCTNTTTPIVEEQPVIIEQPEVIEKESEQIELIDYSSKLIEEYEGINSTQVVQVDLPDIFKVEFLNEDTVKTFIENGTGVIYFGWNTCPWCRNMLPVLLETLNESDIPLSYFNPKESRGANNNTYNYIIEKLGDYLEKDDSRKPKLFVPEVLFIKDGEVKFHHLGTVSGQTDASIPLTEDQREELKNIYIQGLNLLNE